MTDEDDGTTRLRRDRAEAIAKMAAKGGFTVAAAESLTGGQLSADLARASDASTWYRGGVVAYATEVKQEVLNVRPGPVVSEEAAKDMANGVSILLHASTSVAVTGAAGPDSQEGNPPGTVWIAVHHRSETFAELHHLSGEPAEVCAQTCALALDLVVQTMSSNEA